MSADKGQLTSQHLQAHTIKSNEKRPSAIQKTHGSRARGKTICERVGACQSELPRLAVGQLGSRQQKKRKKKRRKMPSKRRKAMPPKPNQMKERVRLDDMMDIRELQQQQHQAQEEHGREMVDVADVDRTSSTSRGDHLDHLDQHDLPFLSSYPRASTIEQLIGSPLDDWDLHIDNYEFFADKK